MAAQGAPDSDETESEVDPLDEDSFEMSNIGSGLEIPRASSERSDFVNFLKSERIINSDNRTAAIVIDLLLPSLSDDSTAVSYDRKIDGDLFKLFCIAMNEFYQSFFENKPSKFLWNLVKRSAETLNRNELGLGTESEPAVKIKVEGEVEDEHKY